MANPEPFTGNRRMARQFILQCKIKFSGEPDKFADEQTRILYAASYMRGVAFEWVTPFLTKAELTPTNPPECFKTFNTFSEAFLLMFDDPERKSAAERQLFALKQGSRSVAATAAEFQRLQVECSFPEDASYRLFYNALNNDIKDELFRAERPSKFIDYIHQAILIEGRLRERRNERQDIHRSRDPRPSPSPSPRQITVRTQAPDPNAMEIDSIQHSKGRRKVLTEERKRRFENNLCLYCGGEGHRVANCPNKSQGNISPRH